MDGLVQVVKQRLLNIGTLWFGLAMGLLLDEKLSSFWHVTVLTIAVVASLTAFIWQGFLHDTNENG